MKTIHRILLFGAVVLALAAALTTTASAADNAHPLDRTLALNLWGAGLTDVALAVKEATDVDIVFYLPDLPADQNTDTVFIVTGQVQLAAVLEALARRFGFRFRVAASGRVELSRGYGWVPREPVLRFPRFDRLAADGSPEATRAFLGEFLKPLPLLDGDFSLTVEPYPLPGKPDSMRATAVLPKEMGDSLVKAIDCLSGDDGDYPVQAAVDRTRLFAQAREYPGDWEHLLARPVSRPQASTLRAVLLDIARQTNTVIVLRAPPANEGALPPDIVSYTLGRICETLTENWRLGRRVFLACGAVVFDRGSDSEFETDARSRELFWSGLAVAGVDAAHAVQAAGDADGLLNRLRREVFPGVWRDPACALAYSPATRRLAVVAPANVVEEVAKQVAAAK